ncbi:hypothetical protein BKI52_19410 [marine bacterium AO1-C]|nr:hypothetical protein BKI52_19410 [marine bacterium AO1-C]
MDFNVSQENENRSDQQQVNRYQPKRRFKPTIQAKQQLIQAKQRPIRAKQRPIQAKQTPLTRSNANNLAIGQGQEGSTNVTKTPAPKLTEGEKFAQEINTQEVTAGSILQYEEYLQEKQENPHKQMVLSADVDVIKRFDEATKWLDSIQEVKKLVAGFDDTVYKEFSRQLYSGTGSMGSVYALHTQTTAHADASLTRMLQSVNAEIKALDQQIANAANAKERKAKQKEKSKKVSFQKNINTALNKKKEPQKKTAHDRLAHQSLGSYGKNVWRKFNFITTMMGVMKDDSLEGIKKHFTAMDITQGFRSKSELPLHKETGNRLTNALRLFESRFPGYTFPNTTIGLGLRHRFHSTESDGKMMHPLGLAFDIEAVKNPHVHSDRTTLVYETLGELPKLNLGKYTPTYSGIAEGGEKRQKVLDRFDAAYDRYIATSEKFRNLVTPDQLEKLLQQGQEYSQMLQDQKSISNMKGLLANPKKRNNFINAEKKKLKKAKGALQKQLNNSFRNWKKGQGKEALNEEGINNELKKAKDYAALQKLEKRWERALTRARNHKHQKRIDRYTQWLAQARSIKAKFEKSGGYQSIDAKIQQIKITQQKTDDAIKYIEAIIQNKQDSLDEKWGDRDFLAEVYEQLPVGKLMQGAGGKGMEQAFQNQINNEFVQGIVKQYGLKPNWSDLPIPHGKKSDVSDLAVHLKKKFDSWRKTKHAKRKTYTPEQALAELNGFIASYPKFFIDPRIKALQTRIQTPERIKSRDMIKQENNLIDSPETRAYVTKKHNEHLSGYMQSVQKGLVEDKDTWTANFLREQEMYRISEAQIGRDTFGTLKNKAYEGYTDAANKTEYLDAQYNTYLLDKTKQEKQTLLAAEKDLKHPLIAELETLVKSKIDGYHALFTVKPKGKKASPGHYAAKLARMRSYLTTSVGNTPNSDPMYWQKAQRALNFIFISERNQKLYGASYPSLVHMLKQSWAREDTLVEDEAGNKSFVMDKRSGSTKKTRKGLDGKSRTMTWNKECYRALIESGFYPGASFSSVDGMHFDDAVMKTKVYKQRGSKNSPRRIFGQLDAKLNPPKKKEKTKKKKRRRRKKK